MIEKINFYDEELSTFIFLQTDFSKVEFSPKIFFHIFSENLLKQTANIYLNFLEQHENEKFNNLKDEDGFELLKILDSLCQDLNSDFSTYSAIFFLVNSKLKAEYKEKYRETPFSNPLEEVLQSPFLTRFFKGLDFNKTEQLFFLLNILNSKWGWIFPTKESNNFNEEIFFHILEKLHIPLDLKTRNLNEKLIHLGLFSDFWTPADYVDSYFQDENQSFSKVDINTDFEMDSVDYKEVLKVNKTDFSLFSKLLTKAFENNETVFELLSGTNIYRLKNFLSYCFKNQTLSVKNLFSKDFSDNPKELIFYIFALAQECSAEKSVLTVETKYLKTLLKENEDNDDIFKKLFSKTSDTSINFDLLSKLKTPVILFYDNPEETTSQNKMLIENLKPRNITVSFSWKLKLPKENKYSYCAKRFFANNKDIPLSLLGTIADECKNLKINPENWPEIVTIFSHGTMFSKNDVKSLLHNKFNINKSQKGKQNSRYSFKALNTEPAISEVVEALKNAKKWKDNSDERFGCLIKNSGPSGTGKTAFAKEIAKKLDMPLKIVHASDLLSAFSGETEQNIKKVFDEARETNSILLFDEADTFLHSRGDSVNRHQDFKVNEFLTQMDDFTGILFCNTNLPELFDKATDRRFNFKVEFKNLTKEGIDILCNTYFEDYSLSENQKEQIFKAGNVTPGDFGSLFNKIHFISKEKINSEFICQELIALVKQKKRSFENSNNIGFSL